MQNFASGENRYPLGELSSKRAMGFDMDRLSEVQRLSDADHLIARAEAAVMEQIADLSKVNGSGDAGFSDLTCFYDEP
jgi:hypothetical protein